MQEEVLEYVMTEVLEEELLLHSSFENPNPDGLQRTGGPTVY